MGSLHWLGTIFNSCLLPFKSNLQLFPPAQGNISEPPASRKPAIDKYEPGVNWEWCGLSLQSCRLLLNERVANFPPSASLSSSTNPTSWTYLARLPPSIPRGSKGDTFPCSPHCCFLPWLVFFSQSEQLVTYYQQSPMLNRAFQSQEKKSREQCT